VKIFIAYKYTSTGTKRQTKRVRAGQPDSYTLFDGEMIYTYTGSDPSLSNFTISETQNEEGRFANGRLEYGYTDHLGNLRLSYRDSSGVAVIVQSHAYDAWGFEIKSLRYGLSGALSDKYTWQGKEDLSEDGLDNWSDFGWRIEDRALGRWFTPDPADQFESVSTYGYCSNNPVSNIDPDGRALPVIAAAALIGAGISALTYTASVAFSEGGFNNWNWGSFAKQVGVGGLSGALSGAVGGAFGGVGDFSKELSRAFTHGMVQANVAAFTGGDVGSAFLSSFLGSGIGSAANGLSKAGQLGISALSGAGISTAINGGNFWENLAYSSAVVGLNHLVHKGADKPKPKKPINWAKVVDGTITVVGGGAATVGGCLACLTGVGAPAGAVGITLGIPTVGFGTANIIDGFQGNSSDIPGGIFEALDKGFGGNGTIGQVGDAVSGGLPKNSFDGAMLIYDVSQWNPTQSVFNTPSMISPGRPLGVTPTDNTRVNNRYIAPIKK
jgi:RHS repeat-associated protein